MPEVKEVFPDDDINELMSRLSRCEIRLVSAWNEVKDLMELVTELKERGEIAYGTDDTYPYEFCFNSILDASSDAFRETHENTGEMRRCKAKLQGVMNARREEPRVVFPDGNAPE